MPPIVTCPRCGREFTVMSMAEGRRVVIAGHKAKDGRICAAGKGRDR